MIRCGASTTTQSKNCLQELIVDLGVYLNENFGNLADNNQSNSYSTTAIKNDAASVNTAPLLFDMYLVEQYNSPVQHGSSSRQTV